MKEAALGSQANLQDFSRRNVGQVLVELCNQLGVTLALLSEQVELLLLVAVTQYTKYFKSVSL